MLDLLGDYIRTKELTSPLEAIDQIRNSMNHGAAITGATHNFYKYPACFPPTFVRTVIKNFSEPGDTVFDPFMGGGTTAVEAMIMGRNAIGSDLNDLALQSSRAKTLLLNREDIEVMDRFVTSVYLSSHKKANVSLPEEVQPLFRDINPGLRDSIIMMKSLCDELTSGKTRIFAHSLLLRAAKIAIDNKKEQRDKTGFLSLVQKLYDEMIEQSVKYRAAVAQTVDLFGLERTPTCKLYKADLRKPGSLERVARLSPKVNLVVTSPPYPGKHILYNRWQVQGRRETALPYWLIDSGQFTSTSNFTFGYRKSNVGIESYFKYITTSFSSIGTLLNKGALVVQVVAFADKKTQFLPYLAAMKEAGYSEIRNLTKSSFDGRVWRTVPNRKWYNAALGSKKHSCEEVVFFHRKV